MNMITISRELNLTEADLKFARLQGGGFHPFINHEASSIYMGTAIATGGFLVQVPETESAEAQEFLTSSVSLDTPLE
jgi:hypothetical protein